MKTEEIIIAARKKKGYSQSETAKLLGHKLNQTYSLRQYQRIETGDFPKYKKEIIKALGEILDVNIYDIIYAENVPREKTDLAEAAAPYQIKSKPLSESEGIEFLKEHIKDLRETNEWIKKMFEKMRENIEINLVKTAAKIEEGFANQDTNSEKSRTNQMLMMSQGAVTLEYIVYHQNKGDDEKTQDELDKLRVNIASVLKKEDGTGI